MAPACRAGFAAVIAIVGAAIVALAQALPPAPQSQPPAAVPSAESVKKAEQALADARKALGGDKLADLKTLVASGRTRRIRGNNLVPIEFEILIELPDKYVRVDEFPAEDTDPTSAGFNGDGLIQIPPPQAMPAGRGAPAGRGPTAGAAQSPPPPAPGGRGPAMDPRRARVTSVRQDYARLALGLFAASSALAGGCEQGRPSGRSFFCVRGRARIVLCMRRTTDAHPVTLEELRAIAKGRFGDMVKGVVDLRRGIMLLDADMHADEEAELLADGSSQQDLWGINLYPDLSETDWLEFDSMINIRPSFGNRSRGVDDPETREQISKLVQRLVRR